MRTEGAGSYHVQRTVPVMDSRLYEPLGAKMSRADPATAEVHAPKSGIPSSNDYQSDPDAP